MITQCLVFVVSPFCPLICAGDEKKMSTMMVVGMVFDFDPRSLVNARKCKMVML